VYVFRQPCTQTAKVGESENWGPGENLRTWEGHVVRRPPKSGKGTEGNGRKARTELVGLGTLGFAEGAVADSGDAVAFEKACSRGLEENVVLLDHLGPIGRKRT
jgi:hypothetical protein